MITVTDSIYRALAVRLIEQIGSSDFFNGSVEHDTDEFGSRLTATLIIYRGRDGAITDIVPVWWEYHLEQCRGEAMTDFSWREFREYLAEFF